MQKNIWAKPGKESSMKDKNKLAVIDGETLMDMRLVPTKFGKPTAY